MKKQIINKVVLNVDYKNFKLGETISFSEDKTEQSEAQELINSGIGKIVR